MLARMVMKRALATVLWFFSGLLVGSMAQVMLGLPGVVAPVLAIVAAAFVAVDPAQLFWARRPGTHPQASARAQNRAVDPAA
jgi:hypothetical protein